MPKISSKSSSFPNDASLGFVPYKKNHKRGPNWSTEQDRALMEAVRLHGNKWDIVAKTKELSARGATPGQCNSHYINLKKKFAGKDNAPAQSKSDISSPSLEHQIENKGTNISLFNKIIRSKGR